MAAAALVTFQGLGVLRNTNSGLNQRFPQRTDTETRALPGRPTTPRDSEPCTRFNTTQRHANHAPCVHSHAASTAGRQRTPTRCRLISTSRNDAAAVRGLGHVQHARGVAAPEAELVLAVAMA
eukprot:GHRQ01022631.1.p1 GENE.GHRQ01022631.1~~GHRQ01022631.1.p1  ORF type:complete len:123 (+),score=2.34 GHRQ01022631.1:183-551(+)